MTPRERTLAALRREAVDYAPCLPVFWSSPTVEGFTWETAEKRLEVCINRLGVDALLDLGFGVDSGPDVTSRAWEDHPAGERYPLLHKLIETPVGRLSATIRRTEDWEHGNDIPLVSDWVVSRIVKPWIETERDMDCFEYLWRPPERTNEQIHDAMAPIRALAKEWQVPIRGHVGMGLTTSLSLFGAEQACVLSMDKPELMDRLAEIEHRATMRNIELCARAGVDFLSRNGFYETTDFWSPAQIERFLVPRQKREVALAHEAGLRVAYTACTGLMPMIPQLKAVGFDCLFSVEPALGEQDMGLLARELGPTTCFWAGLSAPIHIGEGRPEIVRQAVRDFYATFGTRGTILMAGPSIRPHWPWGNVVAMVEEWKTMR